MEGEKCSACHSAARVYPTLSSQWVSSPKTFPSYSSLALSTALRVATFRSHRRSSLILRPLKKGRKTSGLLERRSGLGSLLVLISVVNCLTRPSYVGSTLLRPFGLPHCWAR